MSGEHCACLKVIYDPREHEGGTKSARWVCGDCGAEFMRKLAGPGPAVGQLWTWPEDSDCRDAGKTHAVVEVVLEPARNGEYRYRVKWSDGKKSDVPADLSVAWPPTGAVLAA